MAILYALVARGTVVLAEFSATSTNASAIARQILEKIPGTSDTHVSYSQDRYIFHVKRTDGLTVLCMAEDNVGQWLKPLRTARNVGRIPFAFLEEIHQRFVKTYGRAIHTAPAYAMNDEFSRVLSQQMDYFSNDPNADRLNRLKGEMSQVRNVMIENIDKVLDRGERLELLVDKTATLQGNTLRFRKQARRFRNTVWWRNCRLMFTLIIVLLIIIYIVLAFVCHGPLLPSCFYIAAENSSGLGSQRYPEIPSSPHPKPPIKTKKVRAGPQDLGPSLASSDVKLGSGHNKSQPLPSLALLRILHRKEIGWSTSGGPEAGSGNVGRHDDIGLGNHRREVEVVRNENLGDGGREDGLHNSKVQIYVKRRISGKGRHAGDKADK
ncbi:hypothetical protein Cgig2_027810 [Carnegiea gigantea]|uniref:Uncharacterized protein n=1 Tax=Carnegiea gigantea TaxID=171969 RepID=A0A9Q1QAH7_9CARY|nr:hypothetical protein Cgig2_027810 [Carnegiea gigantea]